LLKEPYGIIFQKMAFNIIYITDVDDCGFKEDAGILRYKHLL
jgi:hypothetical protein